MLRTAIRTEWQWAIWALAVTGISAAVMGFLYWAQAIVIPLALAVFFTFVLAPVVAKLEKLRLGRITAVLATVGVLLLSLGAVGWVIGQQAASLTQSLPDHAENIKSKVKAVKSWISGDSDGRLGKLFDDVSEMIAPTQEPRPAGASAEAKPVKVVMEPPSTWTTRAQQWLDPFLEVLGQVAFSLILVVFMLVKKEDLRDRMIRIICPNRVAAAMKATDEASRRISRYLLTQLFLNVAYGVVVAVGMLLLEVRYALLWGFIAGIIRYIPYLGPWVGALLPIGFSLATHSGWFQPVAVALLIIVLELLSNNLFEPWLYGASLGMSEMAQLVSAAFWAFLWGPIGLILSSPLTVCLLILGKYVPQFQIFEVLLGDQPPLEPGVILFERLSARDQDEASRLLKSELKDSELTSAADGVVIPALRLTKAASQDGDLTDAEVANMLRMLDEILFEHRAAARALAEEAPADLANDLPPVRLLACPAQDEADHAAMSLLLEGLEPRKWEVRAAGAATLAAELAELEEAFRPTAVLISSMPPGGAAHARYLCKRLRQRGTNVKIIVGRWGEQCSDDIKGEFTAAGADEIVCGVGDALKHLQSWRSAFAAAQKDLDQGCARPQRDKELAAA